MITSTRSRILALVPLAAVLLAACGDGGSPVAVGGSGAGPAAGPAGTSPLPSTTGPPITPAAAVAPTPVPEPARLPVVEVSATSSEAIPPVALIDDAGRITVVRDGAAEPALAGVLTPDGRTAVAARAVGDQTELTWNDLSSGETTATVRLAGRLNPVVVEPAGRVVALVSEPVGRVTEIVVAGPDGERFRRTYERELVPEAFANAWTDSRLPIGLFVIDYLDPPGGPAAPRTYRVAVVDLATGEIGLPLNLRDKSQTVDEQMTGYARAHLVAERDGLLFTLYRGVGPGASTSAFIHTLGFVNGVWCLAVPEALRLDREPGSMALATDGSRLYVGSANGSVAEFVVGDILDPNLVPAARRVVAVTNPPDTVGAPVMATVPGRLVAAQGSTISWIDPATLQAVGAVAWPRAVEAIAGATDDNLLVADHRRLGLLRPDGVLLAGFELPPSIGAISRIVPL